MIRFVDARLIFTKPSNVNPHAELTKLLAPIVPDVNYR